MATQAGLAVFAETAASIEPIGELVQITIAGQRYVMTRNSLLTTLEIGRRAIVKQDADRATVIPFKPKRAKDRKTVRV